MYAKFVKKLIWLFERILIFFMIVMIVIIGLQVFFRYFLRNPLHWSEQTARLLFIWCTFLGVPVLFHGKVSMSFDMLIDKVKGKGRDVISIVIHGIIIALAAFFFVSSMQLVVRSVGVYTQGVRVPVNALYISIPISMVALVLVEIDKAIEEIKRIRKGGDKECS